MAKPIRRRPFPSLFADRERWGIWVSGGLLAAASLAGVTAVLGQLGRWWPPADSVNHLAPVWLTFGLMAAAGLVAVSARFGRLGLAILAGLGLTGFTTLAPELLARHSPKRLTSAHSLRIVQFNVWKENRSPDQALRWIIDQDADIVVLEEAAVSGMKIRRGLRGLYPYAVDCLGAEGRCSTIILSNRPFTASGGLARSDPENRKALSAAWATFASPDGPFTVVGVHYTRPWPFSDQSIDTENFERFLALSDRHRMVVTGDFNLTPWTFAMKRQDRAFQLQRVTRSLATWPVLYPRSGRTSKLPPVLGLDHI